MGRTGKKKGLIKDRGGYSEKKMFEKRREVGRILATCRNGRQITMITAWR